MTTTSFSERMQQLSRFFELKKLDYQLLQKIKHFTKEAEKIKGVSVAEVFLDVDEIQEISSLIDRGATSHLKPGSIDRLFRVPTLLALLINKGAKPTQDFVDYAAAFHYEKPLWHLHNQAPNLSKFKKSLSLAIKAAPELDWFKFYENRSDIKKMFVLDMNNFYKGIFDVAVKARIENNLPVGPQNENTDIYDELLFHVFRKRNDVPWPDEYEKEIIASLVKQGANPNLTKTLSYPHQGPLLAHAAIRRPHLMGALLENGAIVTRDVISSIFYVFFDKEMYQRKTISEEAENARLEGIIMALKQSENLIDWDMTIPSNDFYKPKLSFLLTQNSRTASLRSIIEAHYCQQDLEKNTASTQITQKKTLRL